jgi:hypothetical protein
MHYKIKNIPTIGNTDVVRMLRQDEVSCSFVTISLLTFLRVLVEYA